MVVHGLSSYLYRSSPRTPQAKRWMVSGALAVAAAVVAANPMRDDASLRLPQTESEMMRRRRAAQRRRCSIWKYVRAPVTLLSRALISFSLSRARSAITLLRALYVFRSPAHYRTINCIFFKLRMPEMRQQEDTPADLGDPILKRRKLHSRHEYCSVRKWYEISVLICDINCLEQMLNYLWTERDLATHALGQNTRNRKILRSNILRST